MLKPIISAICAAHQHKLHFRRHKSVSLPWDHNSAVNKTARGAWQSGRMTSQLGRQWRTLEMPISFLISGFTVQPYFSCMQEGIKKVVNHPSFGKFCDALIEENTAAQIAYQAKKAKFELLKVWIPLSGFKCGMKASPTGTIKEKMMDAINSARKNLSLKDCLESIGLSATRYQSLVKYGLCPA